MSARRNTKRPRRASLADALFSSTQQKVLGLLFGQPDRSFFVTEIMARVASGRGVVQRELERLASGGLIIPTRVGNQKHFQANRESPLFEELVSIVTKTVGLAEPLKSALESLPGRVKLALIYGSVAKKADSSASDVDLLLVADDLSLEGVYAAVGPAEEQLGRKINPTLYTSEEYARRRKSGHSFLKQVLTGPTLLLAGSVDGECAAREPRQDRRTESGSSDR